MLRSINILDLPEAAKLKLRDLGYEYCEDIEREMSSSGELPSNLKSIGDKYNLVNQLRLDLFDIESAVDEWSLECSYPPVAIFHEGLDKLLRGGFPIGRTTEICGAPGSGKTQLCLQAAIDVQIPSELGGSSGESLFISTDFGFRVRRLRKMAEESVKHIARLKNVAFSVDTVLSGVNVIKVFGCEKLQKVISNLESYLVTNRNIKIVIIDSFSLPVVSEIADLLERTEIVHFMLNTLQELSMKYKFALILTNQLTTVIAPNEDKRLIPSLGEGFGHRLHKRLLLDDGKACLVKSIDQAQLFAEFQITEAGIR